MGKTEETLFLTVNRETIVAAKFHKQNMYWFSKFPCLKKRLCLISKKVDTVSLFVKGKILNNGVKCGFGVRPRFFWDPLNHLR